MLNDVKTLSHTFTPEFATLLSLLLYIKIYEFHKSVNYKTLQIKSK